MTELERYKEAFARLDDLEDDVVEHAKHGDITVNAEILKQAIRLMLNDVRNFITEAKMTVAPPVEMEDVNVVRWMCRHCEKVWPGDTIYEPCCGSPLVRLAGTFQRPKPQPVERSVSREVKINQYGAVHSRFSDLCALKDLPECHGKNGVLTFTWTE